MALIIAIVLIAIVGVKVFNDKASAAASNAESEARHKEGERFEDEHINKPLQSEIWDMFENAEKLPQIHEEVDTAFSQMPHWKGMTLLLHPSEFQYTNGKFTQKAYKEKCARMKNDRVVAVDIMLANRGYISSTASWCGYESYIHARNTVDEQNAREMQYELVRWIRDTLAKQSIHVEPVLVKTYSNKETDFYHVADRYGWCGSHYTINSQALGCECSPLDHSLIESP